VFDRRFSGALQPCRAQNHGELIDELHVDWAHAVEVCYSGASSLATHVHPTATLCVLLEGGASERRGPAMVEQRAFEIMPRAADEAHENQYHARGARSLVIELDANEPSVRAALARPASHDANTTRDLALRLVAAFRAPASARARELSRAIRDTLVHLAPARRAPLPAWLEAAREILVARVADPPTLEELGRAVGVHPVYLAQTFRARWGATPRQLVRAHRVFRAIELIEGGSPLAAAATAVGFADQSHMTRAITAARHASPGAIRRAMRPSTP